MEKENPMEILSGLVFEIQRDYPKDKNCTEYAFRCLDDDGLTKEDLALQRKFNPHKLHVYVSYDKKIDDLMLVGFVYRKDSFSEFIQNPVEPEIAKESDYEIIYSDNPKYVFPDKDKKELK